MTKICILKGVEHQNYRSKRFSKSLHDAIKSKKKADKKSYNVKANDINDEQLKYIKRSLCLANHEIRSFWLQVD